MNKWMTIVAAALACAGCFDNRAKPEDVPTVIGLQTLIATNRANIVRVILRGEKGEIPAAALEGLNAIKMIDLSERGTKEVPAAVFALKGIKEFYFARNGLGRREVHVRHEGHDLGQGQERKRRSGRISQVRYLPR